MQVIHRRWVPRPITALQGEGAVSGQNPNAVALRPGAVVA